MMNIVRALLLATLFLPLPSLRAAEPAKETGPVSYYRDIRPLFAQNCQGCHQPAKASGGYVMTSHEALLKKGDSDEAGIVPGKPEASLLLTQITAQNGQPPAMPRGKDPLTEQQVNLIKRWIAQGAPDDTPPSARMVPIDAEHPPTYALPPVITALDYAPDGQLLAVSGYHEVLLHQADGSGLVARLVGASERIQSLAFSPDGTRLAVTGGNPGRFGEVQIWDVAKRKLLLSVPVTYDTVYGASWSPDGSMVAFGCADNTLRAIDAKSGKQVLFQGAHSDWVLATVFSVDGTHLVSVSRDRSMKLTEVATQRFIDNITSITPGALKGGLLTVSRRPQKPRLLPLSGSAAATVGLVGSPLGEGPVAAATVMLVGRTRKMAKVSPDTPGAAPKIYDELLIGGSDGVPRLYKMHRETKRVIGDDANKVREYEAMPGRIYAGCFNADGSLLAVGSSLDGRGEVRIYQVADGKRVSVLAGEHGAIYAVKFHPDGKQIVSAGFDGMVRLNDVATGKLLREFLPVPAAAQKVAATGGR